MDDDSISVLVLVEGKTKTIVLPASSSISHLYDEVSKKCAFKISLEDMRLNFAGTYLECDNGKSLSDYNITNMSTIGLVIRVIGGVWPIIELREKERTLDPLPGFIQITKTMPDMISLDDDHHKRRAVMPCGHVIGPDSMTQYCWSNLEQGKYVFKCPYVDPTTLKQSCNTNWEYFLVRHVACLSVEQKQKFEKRIIDNYMQKESGIQTCPGCGTWCSRQNAKNPRVKCQFCTRKTGSEFEFCWNCMGRWTNVTGGTKWCGNPNCKGRDLRLDTLATCPMKMIESQQFPCPSVRGCPKCGILIEHKEACKHMHCTSCHHGFCFCCLKPKKADGYWECGSFTGICPVAPRQTYLPGTN